MNDGAAALALTGTLVSDLRINLSDLRINRRFANHHELG